MSKGSLLRVIIGGALWISLFLSLWTSLHNRPLGPIRSDLPLGPIRTAVVVLGQSLHRDLMPRAGMKARVRHAVGVWNRLKGSAVVVLCGAGKAEERALHPDLSEARVMLDLMLCEVGAPPRHRIILEEGSTNTAENARNAMIMLEKEKSLAVVYVVTAAWHALRASVPFQVFAPLHWDVVMEGAPDPTPGAPSTQQDMGLLGSTLSDVARLRKGEQPKESELLWQYALRSLNREEEAAVVGYSSNCPPPNLLPPNVVVPMGPCQRKPGAVAGILVTLDPLDNAAAACALGEIVFCSLPENYQDESGARVTRLSPLNSQRVGVRVDCSSSSSSSSSSKDIFVARTAEQLATHLHCGAPQ